jgi:RNA recognition motif-containing protein
MAKESVEEACRNVNGSFWHGRRITCIPRDAPSTSAKAQEERADTLPSTQLFIGNIPYETTDAELNRLFKGIANLQDVRVAVDRTTGWPRGFAHADFASVEAARDAKEKLKGAMLGTRTLRIDFASGYNKRARNPRNGRDGRVYQEDRDNQDNQGESQGGKWE